MATPAVGPAGTSATKSSRGKDQIQWSDDVWKGLDTAVTEEMMRTRVAAKFLPQVHVPKKRTNVESDVVVVPSVATVRGLATAYDPTLSVDESKTTRIQEYWTTFRLSVAQVEAEGHEEGMMHPSDPPAASAGQASATGTHGAMPHPQRASTASSLSQRAANILAQSEDLVLLNGQNAVVNGPLFVGGIQLAGGGATGPLIQFLDQNLATDLDSGLLNIQPVFNSSTAQPTQANLSQLNINLPSATQVIPVHPTAPGSANTPPVYAEATLNAVASAFSALQGLGHYENYALVLHTIPYADLHNALKSTLIEPVEPVSHLVKAGIFGTGAMPPFTPIVPGPPTAPPAAPTAAMLATGLPTQINGNALSTINGFLNPTPTSGAAPPVPRVLYTGVLVSLSGNTMDLVRGQMEDNLDVVVTFNQKDQNEQYRFRVVQRFTLRLKDPTAVALLLFLDS
jgi:hypothetical protein